MVLDAVLLEDRRVSAHLLLADRTQEECVAHPVTGEVTRRSTLPTAGRVDQGQPSFMLERRCVDARRVEDAEGRELGWLAYPACG
jgi:hypothetical protein